MAVVRLPKAGAARPAGLIDRCRTCLALGPRDGHAVGPRPGETLPGFIHRINAEWVAATVRLIPVHGIENAAGYYSASHDHSTGFYIAHTCFFLSAVLFVLAIVGLARLVHPRHPKAAFWGCVLSLMGFIDYGALDGIDYMAWVAGKPDTGLDPATMQRYIEVVLSTNAILVPVLLVFTLLPVGLIVLGRSLPSRCPSQLARCIDATRHGGRRRSLQYPVLLVISALALLASFGLVGTRLLRAPSGSLAGGRPL